MFVFFSQSAAVLQPHRVIPAAAAPTQNATLTRVTLKKPKTNTQTRLAVWFEDLTELFPAGQRHNYIWFRGKQRVQIANGEVAKERNALSKQVALRTEGGFKLK